MTKQEAIKILERDCPKRPQKLWSVKRTEAIHMAIEALKTRTDGDTISRRDAIDAAECIVDHHSITPYETMRSAIDHLKRIIDGMPSAQPEQRWIPCSERLPEEETEVLVTRTFLGCKDGSRGRNAHIPPKTYVEVAQYFNGEWIALSDEYKVARSRHTNPVAWIPLPEPYMRGEQ